MQSKISSSFLCIGLVASFVFADTNSTNSSEPNSAKHLWGGGLLKTYELGAVEITAPNQVDSNPSIVHISAKDMKNTNSDNLAQALRFSTGVMFEDPRGGMGSSTIKVRGFGSSMVGFYLDGIPIMSGYNRGTDYAHFVTQGISSVQISKRALPRLFMA